MARTLPPMDYAEVGHQLARVPLENPTRTRWLFALGLGFSGVMLLVVSVAWLFYEGVGVWGINIPVNWGMAIINVVWWIGIGHAGTFISAMLLLLGRDWRNSLNRFAEAMTIFAVICAVMYPILHLGRPWNFYFMIPYPGPLGVWPQFRSPLEWDMFAFFTYFNVSALFWYVGLIPDFAVLRDRARTRLGQVGFGLLALGWRGSARHWVRWRRCYLLLAGLAMPLVVSVHSGVALLFAVGTVPGWHTTVFPPYFVIGAVFSGFAVVAMIAIVLRAWFRLYNLVTPRHLDLLAKLVLATGLMTGYGYITEAFTEWYAQEDFELGTLMDRFGGEYAWAYWGAVAGNLVAIQALWFKAVRTSPVGLFVVSLAVAVGMWFERYMLVVTSLYRDFLPSSWGRYDAPFWEWSLYIGTIGLFVFLMVLFIRVAPMISISETKEVIRHDREKEAGA